SRLFSSCSGAYRDLHSFPTRRSSDLRAYVNRVCKYLLLRHAFENLNAQVVGFRTDHLNLPSQKAIEALGAKRDGIIRCHMLRKDRQTIRDSYIYSILESEWVYTKVLLQSKLMKYSRNNYFEI